jgi:hypothetical protein
MAAQDGEQWVLGPERILAVFHETKPLIFRLHIILFNNIQ